MDKETTPHIVPSLERATHAVALLIARSLRDVDVSQAEAHVLGYLMHTSQCAINDLHASFGHRRSTLTSILDRLESRGLVRRGRHPASRRLVLVELTEAGREVGARVSTVLDALEDAVVARTGRDEVDAFFRVLAAIEEGVE